MRALALAMGIVALLLVPGALADHVYSHRVYVMGRILDGDGRPAAGVPLDLTFDGFRAPQGCFDNKPERTGPRGDYEICRHVHTLPSNGTVTVRAGNVSHTVGVDANLRLATASFRLDAPAVHDVSGERQFARTFTVVGRPFTLLPAPTTEEGVMVNATVRFENVTLEMRVGDLVLTSAEATPDEYGIYRADLSLDEVPPGAFVRATIGRDIGEKPASPLFRRADVNVVQDLTLLHGPGDDAPGSSPTPTGAWVAVAATLLGVVLGRRRVRRD